VKEFYNQSKFVKVMNECTVAQLFWLTVYNRTPKNWCIMRGGVCDPSRTFIDPGLSEALEWGGCIRIT